MGIDPDGLMAQAISTLKARGGLGDCPSCKQDVARYLRHYVDTMQVGALQTICSNCGFMASHHLDLLLGRFPPPPPGEER